MMPLNKDQLDGLAKLCFDLAKGAYILAISAPISSTSISAAFSGLKGVLLGLAFTHTALVLLKLKEQAK